MNKFSLFVGQKTAITHQAFENHFKGSGNPRAIDIAIEVAKEVGDRGSSEVSLDKSHKHIITEMLLHGASVFIYSDNNYLIRHHSRSDIDGALVKLSEGTLKVLLFRGEATRATLEAPWAGDFIGALNNALISDGYREPNGSFAFYGVTPAYYIIPTNLGFSSLDGWQHYRDELGLENKFDKTTVIANTNNSAPTKINSNTGEVKMTKATAIVTANKTAALNVAKLEAGRIAVKQAVKLVKPAVPMMARGYLDTALGALVVANLFKFAVDNFATSNPKAQLVAGAMLEGAMLEAMQSLNIEAMISEVMDKVDVSKFTDILKTDSE